MEERFSYIVCPKTPIRNIVKGKLICRPTILQLTKSEVLTCMKSARVFRKFYLEHDSELVTKSNLDRLHKSVHFSEKEYNDTLLSDVSKLNEIADEDEKSKNDSLEIMATSEEKIDEIVLDEQKNKSVIQEDSLRETPVVEDTPLEVTDNNITLETETIEDNPIATEEIASEESNDINSLNEEQSVSETMPAIEEPDINDSITEDTPEQIVEDTPNINIESIPELNEAHQELYIGKRKRRRRRKQESQ